MRRWRFPDGFLLAALCVGAVLACLPVWLEIARLAIRDPEQSHILLAPLIIAWLVWVRRERLILAGPSWSIVGPAIMLASWLAMWFGYTRSVDLARHAGAVGVLLGGVTTIAGPVSMWRIAAAVGATVFLLPIPGRIRQPLALVLQESGAWAAQGILEFLGVACQRTGNVLIVNGHSVAVAEACNGMRMIGAVGLVTYLFVFAHPMRWRLRLVLIAISPIIALLVNVIRLVPTALMFGYAGEDAAEGFHDLSGWLMLLLALGLLWGFLALLRWCEVPVDRVGVRGAA
ncbi:MAG: exosortase/archaeosortase family protein [Phycisphaerales bacterium]|jgi:exosortase|nr:exosortase/archaeosortase family protein [Phycisphaerales bacterium]